MNNKKYCCTICEKYYKTPQSLCNHKRIYHIHLNTKMYTNDVNLNTSGIHNVSVLKNQQVNDNNICKMCNKTLSNRQSRWRHEKICKKNKLSTDNTLKEKNNILKNNSDQIIKDLQNKMNVLELQLSTVLNQRKIHPKTLQKINKNLINGNNNSINNGIINNINNINIVKFGSENIKDILNEKEILKILNSRYGAIEESIKEVHFNESRPEYRNILITNLRDNIAYVYNGTKFEAVQKQSVISDLIDQHMNNIEVSLENYKHKLPEKTANIIDKLLQKLDDETKITDENNNKEYKNFKSFKTNEIKLMIYNESRKNMEVIKFHL
jgi:cystathionine beta-lyase family protein involved in aluminum resistance